MPNVRVFMVKFAMLDSDRVVSVLLRQRLLMVNRLDCKVSVPLSKVRNLGRSIAKIESLWASSRMLSQSAESQTGAEDCVCITPSGSS